MPVLMMLILVKKNPIKLFEQRKVGGLFAKIK
jgi:hypothetical protein